MSVAPICPVHNKPMALRNGARGPWYSCETFMGPGVPGANDRGYCAYRPPRNAPQAPVAAPAAQPVAEAAQRASGASPRLHAAVAALNAAALTLQGSHPSEEGVLRLASNYYHKFLKVAFTADVPVYMDAPQFDPANPDNDITF